MLSLTTGYLADARQSMATQSLVPTATASGQDGDTTSQSAPLTALFTQISGKIVEEFKSTINSLKVSESSPCVALPGLGGTCIILVSIALL